mmetsp:Transcript_20045/g.35610  ORF Transcript_20045/g.35610 Transcript_20045/m.35610 type:complete len:296 (+) Transcript_20045:330-1217(+)
MLFMQVGTASKRNRKSLIDGLPPENEDRVAYISKEGIAGVFDGHGGSQCVEYISKYLCERVTKEIKKKGLPVTPRPDSTSTSGSLEGLLESEAPAVASALVDAFSRLESEYKTIFEKTGDTSGACGTIAVLRGKTCYVANVGDCRLVYRVTEPKKRGLFSKAIAPIQVTTDHRVDEPGSELERVEREGGVVRNGRIGSLGPSRTFGDWDVKMDLNPDVVTAVPDVSSFQMEESTLIVLATDGVWDAMPNKKVFDIIDKSLRGNPSLDLASARVVEECSKLNHDDVTCVILRFEPL